MKTKIFALLFVFAAITACDDAEMLTFDLGPATIEYPSNYAIHDVITEENGVLSFTCETTYEETLSNIKAEIIPDMDLDDDEEIRRIMLTIMAQGSLKKYYEKINTLIEKNGEQGGITDVKQDQFDEMGYECVTDIAATYAGEKITAKIDAKYIDDWKSIICVVYETTEGKRDLDKLHNIMQSLKLK